MLIFIFNTKINNIKLGFIKFVDSFSECLCPIILSNNMILKFSYDEEYVNCLVSIDSNLIAVSSSMILHDYLSIEIEVLDDEKQKEISFSTIDLEKINPNMFPINIQFSR